MIFKERSIKSIKTIIRGKKAKLSLLRKRTPSSQRVSLLVGELEGLQLALKFIR